MPRYLLPLAERKPGQPTSASGAAWKDVDPGVDRAVEDPRQPEGSRRSS